MNNVKSLFGLEGSVLGDLRAAKNYKEPTMEVIPSAKTSIKSVEDLDKDNDDEEINGTDYELDTN